MGILYFMIIALYSGIAFLAILLLWFLLRKLLNKPKAKSKIIPATNSINPQLLQKMIKQQSMEERANDTETQPKEAKQLISIKVKVNPQHEQYKRKKKAKNRILNKIARKSRRNNRINS